MNFLKKHSDLFALLLILAFSLLLRIYAIDKIPVNITGDESWDLSNVYRIVFDKSLPLFALLGDGSVSAIVFYPVAILIKIFGTENSIFFLRLNIISYSLLALAPFYFILKQKTSVLIAFIFTFLLSANYVFLNFSRTAWVNMMCVFSGLFLIFFIEKAIKEKSKKWYLLSGIFAGISIYGYHYGRIFVIGIIFYLISNLFINKFEKDRLKGFIVFVITTTILSFLFIASFISFGQETVLGRPAATFAFSQTKLSDPNKFSDLFWHQIEYTFRGFITLDGSVMNEGTENSRYLPFKTPPVNLIIKILFISGLIYFVVKRKRSIWWVVFISVLITQFFSDLPPNYSRGLFYIPFIYFTVGVFVYRLIINIARNFRIKNMVYLGIFLIILSAIVFLFDVRTYFIWMQTPYEYNARQPGLTYNEFQKWQKFQIQRTRKSLLPTTGYEWRDSK